MEEIVLSISAVVASIIAALLSLFYVKFSTKSYIINLKGQLYRNHLKNDFYRILYSLMVESMYEKDYDKYIIELKRIIQIMDKFNNETIEISIKNMQKIEKNTSKDRLAFLEKSKILKKRDADTYEFSHEFNNLNDMIHKELLV